MNLLLDCGNTRLKWAICDPLGVGVGGRIIEKGVVDYEADALGAWVAQLKGRALKQLRYASVIGAEQEAHVLAAVAPLGLSTSRFQVAPEAGRLRCQYATPETLGVDRWAAAMGAWGQVGQSCLVIAAGTATTVDLIESTADNAAIYRGGLILPGIALMLQSLHQRAARLPLAEGRYCAPPAVAATTHDAIASGAIEATCGAIERMGKRLPQDAPWLVTGGNAMALVQGLGNRVSVVEDLVLAGLALDLDQRQRAC